MADLSAYIVDEDTLAPLDQQENEEDVHPENSRIGDAVLFNTDWTVETLYRQIEKGNINLDPQFQRREAWNIERKSKFIESILCNLPIPNVVLAEEKGSKGRYIVIDGKQRLFSVLSFFRGEFQLRGLAIRSDLNGYSFPRLLEENNDAVSSIENYPIRTVIIRNWPDEDYLYTVFYRLNSGSLPLSPQELRKALHGGPLLDYLDEYIQQSEAFRSVFGDRLDPRMRDVEIALRFVAFDRFYNDYKGDLKAFLDNTVLIFNQAWDQEKPALDLSLARFDIALEVSRDVFGSNAFKKWNGNEYERRINRAIFDVITRYFSDQNLKHTVLAQRDAIVPCYENLCATDERFRNAIERTTKTPAATYARHLLWGQALAQVLGRALDEHTMRLV